MCHKLNAIWLWRWKRICQNGQSDADHIDEMLYEDCKQDRDGKPGHVMRHVKHWDDDHPKRVVILLCVDSETYRRSMRVKQ